MSDLSDPDTQTLSARKLAIRDFAEDSAAGRADWRARNQGYYDDDRAYMRFLVPSGLSVLDLGCGDGELLAALNPALGVGVDFSPAMLERARADNPDMIFELGDVEALGDIQGLLLAHNGGKPYDVILLSDTMGYLDDCQATLEGLHGLCGPETRVVIAYYSHLWEPVLRIGEVIGMKMRQPEVNFLGAQDITSILHLADFEPIKSEWRQIVPKKLFGIGTAINRFIGTLPIIRRLALRHYVVARSERAVRPHNLSATVLVPCRNERGNIESAVTRLPRFADDIEVLYVEGNSTDGTFEECERVRDHYAKPENGGWDIKVFKQPGKGKGDAVRKGFDEARGDVLMILDADLTMPPEELPKYYKAIQAGKGEFVNGTRLVYPMEKGAMRFLNYWANRTFALIFSFLLNQRFTDTLCGTKVLTRKDYQSLIAGRDYFGEFDPFGDFDLIFGAAKLNLKIVEVPIRYADRTYGEPQISRFRDGWLLLKMVVFAWRKLKAF
jgi:SAM-dependent methyltransferase